MYNPIVFKNGSIYYDCFLKEGILVVFFFLSHIDIFSQKHFIET